MFKESYSEGSVGPGGAGCGIGGGGDSLFKGGSCISCRSTMMKNLVVAVAVWWWC